MKTSVKIILAYVKAAVVVFFYFHTTFAQQSSITISVTDVDNKPITGAVVSVSSVYTANNQTFNTVEQGNGNYLVSVLKNLLYSPIALTVNANGYSPYRILKDLSGLSRLSITLQKSSSSNSTSGTGTITTPTSIAMQIVVSGKSNNKPSYKINDATIVATLGGDPKTGTLRTYIAIFVSNGTYRIDFPLREQSQSGKVTVTAPNHEEYKFDITAGLSMNRDVQLKYNDYTNEYTVDNNHLVETFGYTQLNLDSPQGSVKSKLILPIQPSMVYADGRNPGWHYITNYGYREKMYHDLMKELVLQTAAEASALTNLQIQACVDELVKNKGNSNLDAVVHETITLSKYFNKLFIEKYSYAWGILKGAGILLTITDAARDGTLNGILLAVAYQSFQEDNYNILAESAKKSKLYSDPAFRSAIEKLRETLNKEKSQKWQDIVLKLRREAVGNVISSIAVKEALSLVLPKVLYLAQFGKVTAGIVGFVSIELIMDIMTGIAKRVEIESSLLLMTQIENELLPTEIDGYSYKVPRWNEEISKDKWYGGLMRLHAGMLINKWRGSYYGGTGQGYTQEFLAALKSNPFTRAIIKTSETKSTKAKTDYKLLAFNNKFQSESTPINSFPIDFMNATYKIYNSEEKFTNGVCEIFDNGLNISSTYIDTVIKTSFTNMENEYTIIFTGNPCGAANHYDRILSVISVRNGKMNQIADLGGCRIYGYQIINNEIIEEGPHYLENDAMCCPTYKLTTTYRWNGTKFFAIKSSQDVSLSITEPQKKEFLTVYTEVGKLINKKDNARLANYIHPKIGIFYLDNPGVGISVLRYNTLNELFNCSSYQIKGMPHVQNCTPVFEIFPTYSCADDKWSKDGCFADNASRYRIILDNIGDFDNVDENEKSIYNFAEQSLKIIVIQTNSGGIRLGFSLVDGKWYLSVITVDDKCSA